jgi:hypothetical protein
MQDKLSAANQMLADGASHADIAKITGWYPKPGPDGKIGFVTEPTLDHILRTPDPDAITPKPVVKPPVEPVAPVQTKLFHVSDNPNLIVDASHKPAQGQMGQRFYATSEPEVWQDGGIGTRPHVYEIDTSNLKIASGADVPDRETLTKFGLDNGYYEMGKVKRQDGSFVVGDDGQPIIRPVETKKAIARSDEYQDPMTGSRSDWLEEEYLRANGFDGVEASYSPDGHQVSIFNKEKVKLSVAPTGLPKADMPASLGGTLPDAPAPASGLPKVTPFVVPEVDALARDLGKAADRGDPTMSLTQIIDNIKAGGYPDIEDAARNWGKNSVSANADPKAALVVAAGLLEEKSKKQFGVTRDPKEAGYILSDGSMLDLSGRHYASDFSRDQTSNMNVVKRGQRDWLAGQRSVDHRELENIIDSGGTEGMSAFMTEGRALRFQSGIGFDVMAMPTDKQITRAIRAHKSTTDDSLRVDITGRDGNTAATRDFDRPNVEVVKKWLSQNSDFLAANASKASGAVAISSAVDKHAARLTGKGTIGQYLNTIRNKGGKPDEFTARGLDKLDPNQAVTADEFRQLLADRPYEVTDIVSNSPYTTQGQLTDDVQLLEDLGVEPPGAAAAATIRPDVSATPTKFSQWQMDGPKENYREIKLQLPGDGVLTTSENSRLIELTDKRIDMGISSLSEAEGAEYFALIKKQQPGHSKTFYSRPLRRTQHRPNPSR